MTKHRKSDRPPGDYDVGYKKPPKSSQFKPGQPPHPRAGRRKKKQSSLENTPSKQELDQIVLDVILEELAYTTPDGKQANITAWKAMLKRLVNQALNGNTRAYALLEKRIADAVPLAHPTRKVILEIVDPLHYPDSVHYIGPPGTPPPPDYDDDDDNDWAIHPSRLPPERANPERHTKPATLKVGGATKGRVDFEIVENPHGQMWGQIELELPTGRDILLVPDDGEPMHIMIYSRVLEGPFRFAVYQPM